MGNWQGNLNLKTMNIKHEYIEKETPEENGDIESFHNSIKTPMKNLYLTIFYASMIY